MEVHGIPQLSMAFDLVVFHSLDLLNIQHHACNAQHLKHLNPSEIMIYLAEHVHNELVLLPIKLVVQYIHVCSRKFNFWQLHF